LQPQFIGVGAQKAGTSWIYACLEEHPEICMPVKEIHFFSKQDRYAKGVNWYEGHFDACSSGCQVGEFSTTYLHSEEALERICSVYPNAKIIVSIRDPITRAESHFNNDIMAGMVPKDSHFSDMLLERPEYWQRGLYHRKIQWLLENFGRDKVLVLVLEEGKRDPENFIRSIYRFLGVDASFDASSLKRKINVSAVPRSVIVGKMMDFISRVMRALGMGQIIRYLRARGIIEWARKANASGGEVPSDLTVWPPFVVEELEADRQQLETMLGSDLGYWRSVGLMKVNNG